MDQNYSVVEKQHVVPDVCGACGEIANSFRNEAGHCCVVGNLTEKLDSTEARLDVATQLATTAQMEASELKESLDGALSKTADLELRLRAAEELVRKLRAEIEEKDQQISSLAVDSSANKLLEAITDIALDDSRDNRQSKLSKPCALVYMDKACRKLRGHPTKEIDLYRNLAGDYVFGEFKAKAELTIGEVISCVKKFCADFPSFSAHVLVHAGTTDIAKRLADSTPGGYDEEIGRAHV